jgi:hypothetical protein
VGEGETLVRGLEGQEGEHLSGTRCAPARSAHVGAGSELGEFVEEATLAAAEHAQLPWGKAKEVALLRAEMGNQLVVELEAGGLDTVLVAVRGGGLQLASQGQQLLVAAGGGERHVRSSQPKCKSFF